MVRSLNKQLHHGERLVITKGTISIMQHRILCSIYFQTRSKAYFSSKAVMWFVVVLVITGEDYTKKQKQTKVERYKKKKQGIMKRPVGSHWGVIHRMKYCNVPNSQSAKSHPSPQKAWHSLAVLLNMTLLVMKHIWTASFPNKYLCQKCFSNSSQNYHFQCRNTPRHT